MQWGSTASMLYGHYLLRMRKTYCVRLGSISQMIISNPQVHPTIRRPEFLRL